MFSKLFWKDALERVVSTVAEVLLPVVLADGFNLFSVDWKAMVSLSVSAGAAALFKSVALAKKSNTLSPASFVTADPNDLP